VLHQQDVMIVLSCLFYFPKDHFRVGLGSKNLLEALEQIGLYLRGRIQTAG
jgi:hypothetical protein